MNHSRPQLARNLAWHLAVRHPLAQIPPLPLHAPDIDTEKGPLPGARALAYDNERFLLHGPAATRPGHHFSLEELAGYSKTTTRLSALLRPWPWLAVAPLHWRSPEELLFTTVHCSTGAASVYDGLFYDLIQLGGRLEQLETLALTLAPQPALAFRRC